MFAHRFPALVDPATGMPRRWRQFVAGLQVINRLEARETLRAASAAGAPNMKEHDREDWFRDQRTLAGWEN